MIGDALVGRSGAWIFHVVVWVVADHGGESWFISMSGWGVNHQYRKEKNGIFMRIEMEFPCIPPRKAKYWYCGQDKHANVRGQGVHGTCQSKHEDINKLKNKAINIDRGDNH